MFERGDSPARTFICAGRSLSGALPLNPRKGSALDPPRNLRFLGFSFCLRRGYGETIVRLKVLTQV